MYENEREDYDDSYILIIEVCHYSCYKEQVGFKVIWILSINFWQFPIMHT